MLATDAAVPVQAQTVEVAPFGGYRFGGGFYEIVTGASVDVDGAPSYGALLDVRIGEDLFVEGLFTHQQASFTLPPSLDASQTRWRVDVDHYHVGGLREMRPGRARPFLTGAVGLTRYASQGDDEIRFTLSAGGGVKLFATEHLALRLDGSWLRDVRRWRGRHPLLRAGRLHRLVRRRRRVAGGVYCCHCHWFLRSNVLCRGSLIVVARRAYR